MKHVWIMGFILTCGLTLSCDLLDSNETGDDAVRELSGLEKSLVEADNAFGFKLFREMVASQPDTSIFISPLSVAMALGMALNGADGRTYEDMKNALEFQGLTEAEINDAFRSLIDLLIDLDPEVIFEIANSIWIRENYPVLQEFKDVNQAYFDAEIRELDFSLAEAVDIINGWISDKTHGRIEEVLEYISPDVVMYLINAIYFKGTWTYRFDESETTDGTFTRPDDSKVTCPFMRMTCDLDYFENADFQAVDLPYGNGRFSMTILLPKSGTAVDEIIARLDPGTWAQWMAEFQETELTVSMPRFKLSYERLLNRVLISLGMGIAFGGGADFSRINPTDALYISRVIHKTFVEVDEEGTEAATVTVVEIKYGGAVNRSMRMNRPFLFVIREKHSGTLLFMGKMVDPTMEEVN